MNTRRVLVGCLSMLALWAPAVAAQTLTLTSPAPATPNVTIGSTATYHINVAIPQTASTSSIAVTFTLPPNAALPSGLVYQATSAFGTSGALTCAGATCSLPVPAVSGGRVVTWTFNTIVNNSQTPTDSFFWDITVVVDNIASSVAGANLSAMANESINGGAQTAGTIATSVHVLEPFLTLTTTVLPTNGIDANDTATVTAKLVNSAPTSNGTDARTVTVNFPMPSTLSPVAGSVAQGTCPAFTTTSLGASALSVAFDTLALGSTCQFTFQVKLLTSVNPSQVLNATASSTWQSLPGAVTQLSNFSISSNLRDGNSADSGGSLNNYVSNSSYSITTTPLALAATLLNPNNGSAFNAAVATPVAYQITATIPQGTTPAFTMVDTLPTGVNYVSSSDLSGSQNLAKLTCAGAPCVTPTPTVNGQIVTYSFGDIVNNASNDASPEKLIFNLIGTVANVAQSVAGAQLANSVNIQNTALTATTAAVDVIEPVLTFSQSTTTSSAPNAPQAGDTVTTTVIVTNTLSATDAIAYDTKITYTMPAGGQLLPTSFAPGACTITQSSLTAAAAMFTLGPIGNIAGTNTCSFSFTTKITTAAAPNETETATFAATWTSANGAVAGERTGNITDPGGALNKYSSSAAGNNLIVTTGVPSVAIAITSGTQAAIGAPVTAHVVITLPQGSTSGITLTATIPSSGSTGAMTFGSTANFAASPALSCGGSPCTLPAPTVSSNGHTVTWTFPSVVDSDTNDSNVEAISWDIISYVENSGANLASAGSKVAVTATFAVGTSTGSATTASVSIVEPKLTFTVSSTPGVASGNDLVTVTVGIQNPTSITSATAYETTVTYTLPSGKMTAVAGSYQQLSCPLATPTLSGTSASFVLAPIGANTNCQFSFQARLSSGVNQSETETATGIATWTSQPGAIANSQSAYANDAVERTGNAGNVGGALNNYIVTGLGFTVATPFSTFAFTLPPGFDAPVGSQVVYHASAVIPQGSTAELDIAVHFPAGLVFQQGTNFLATSGITCNNAACALPAPTVTNNGYTAVYMLRNIVNANSSDTSTDMVSFDVIGIVENNATSIAGATYTVSADFTIPGSVNTVTKTANPVTVVEPQLTVSTSSAPATAQGNDLLTVSVDLVNPMSAFPSTAYNARIAFALPANGDLVPVANGYSQGSCPTATQTLTAAAAVFTFASLPPLTNCAFTFQVRLAATYSQQQADSVSGTLTWTSQPVAAPTAQSSYQADSTERTGNMNDPGGALNTYIYNTAFGFSVTTPASTFAYTGPAVATAAVGAPVTYHVRTTVPHGTTPELDVSVSFPSGLAFQKAVNFTTTAGITCGGGACTLPAPTASATSAAWKLTNVVDFNSGGTFTTDTVEWDVVAIVENNSDAVAGASFTTSASFAVGAATANITGGTVTVIEPSLTFSNTSTPALAAANDVVTVTVNVVNKAGVNAATAYDTVVSYAFAAGKLSAVAGGFSQGSCPAGTATSTPSSATFTFASIPAGTTCAFTFKAALGTAVGPLATESATSLATWTSQPGDVTQSESIYAADTVERTGNVGNIGGALNTYSSTALGFSVATRGSTFGFTGPTPARQSVGGVATYHVSAVVPQGSTPAITARVVLPAGLVFQGGANLAVTSGITCAAAPCTLPMPTVSSDGYTIQWTFSNVINHNSGDTLSDTIGFDVLAVVENDATSKAGATYTAHATVSAGANSSTIAAAPLPVTEPAVTFATLSTSATAQANDVSTILVNLQNPTSANGADAYNVTATYALAQGKQAAVAGSFLAGTCPTPATTPVLSGSTASFTFAKLAQGTSCQFSFQVRLTTTVLQSEVEAATAVGTWTSEPNAGAQSIYAADSAARTGNTNDAGGALNNYKATNFGFSISVPASTFVFAGPSVPTASVGQVVLYHTGATIPRATLNQLTVAVTLPAGLVFQQATNITISNGVSCNGLACALPNPAVSNGGHSVSWTITDIVDTNAVDLSDVLEWDIATVVENNSSSVAGASEVATAVISSDISGSKPFTAAALVIGEPAPTFAIVGVPGDANPSEQTTVTVSVKNLIGLTAAPAYNTVVVFALPAGQLSGISGSYSGSSCPTASAVLNDSTAKITFPTIPTGTDCTFSFKLKVDDGAGPNEIAKAVSSATWTSQPATTNDPLSVYASDATQRTGNQSDPGGALNTYKATGFDIGVHVPASYFNGGIGASGGGCSGTGAGDFAWLGLLAMLTGVCAKRRSEKRAT